jgi:hypothetical protein
MNPKGLDGQGKIASLTLLARNQHLDVLAMTETQLTEEHIDQNTPEPELPQGWVMHARPAPHKLGSPHGRGKDPQSLALLTSDHLSSTVGGKEITFPDGQACTWTISNPGWNENVRITLVYISPNITGTSLIAIETHIRDAKTTTGLHIILGDLNSYLGNLQFERHLTKSERKTWGPYKGDPRVTRRLT